MNKIRVNTGTKFIEVNDNGDCIAIKQDASFINKLIKMGKDIDKMYPRVKALKTDSEDYEKEIYNISKELRDNINNLFGDDACKKIFGNGKVDVMPSIFQATDFLVQITPFINELAKELEGVANRVKSNSVKNGTAPFVPVGYMGGKPKTGNEIAIERQAIESGKVEPIVPVEPAKVEPVAPVEPAKVDPFDNENTGGNSGRNIVLSEEEYERVKKILSLYGN